MSLAEKESIKVKKKNYSINSLHSFSFSASAHNALNSAVTNTNIYFCTRGKLVAPKNTIDPARSCALKNQVIIIQTQLYTGLTERTRERLTQFFCSN